MASRRELLDSLKPGMHLDKNFFLKIYGYDITRPGFADDVIRRLEILGCSMDAEYIGAFKRFDRIPKEIWSARVCTFFAESEDELLVVIERDNDDKN